jgi:hypothetical protein
MSNHVSTKDQHLELGFCLCYMLQSFPRFITAGSLTRALWKKKKRQLAKFEIHSLDGDPTLTQSRRMTFSSKAINRDEDSREHLTNTIAPRNHTAEGSNPKLIHPHETKDNEVYLFQSTLPSTIEFLISCQGGSQCAYCHLFQACCSISPPLFNHHYTCHLMFIVSFCTHRDSSHFLMPLGSVRHPTQ